MANKSKNQNTANGKTALNSKSTTSRGGAAVKKKTDPKKRAIIITSAVLALILIVSAVFILVNIFGDDDKNFNYITSDLSKYIKMDRDDYKNYSLSLTIAKPHDIDVDVTILNLLASRKDTTPKDDGAKNTYGTIGAGDSVYIYYRGYLKDADGNEVYVANMCNFANADPTNLEIGSNSFVPGFELDLVGVQFTKENRLVKITEGTPTDGQIIYISYTKQLDGSTSSSTKTTAVAERIILGEDDIDATYGAGFEEVLRASAIGDTEGVSFSAEIDGSNYTYTNLKIDFATECENEDTYFMVECYFPYDYDSTTLQNKTAYFEVYVHGMVDYDAPDFTNEFIEENLESGEFGITLEDLEKYDGELTEKLRAYIEEILWEDYEDSYEEALEDAMWSHYHSSAVTEIIKYPNSKVDAVYDEYYADVVYQYETNSGVITSSYTGTSTTCESVDEYATIYLGLEYSDIDWKDYLYEMSKSLVKERLILYYIMREEGLMPTDAELAAQIKASKEEYLEEYISQYSDKYSIVKSDYTDSEWAEFVSAREAELYAYYDDDYFTETAYYEIALRSFLTWPSITTLDTPAEDK